MDSESRQKDLTERAVHNTKSALAAIEMAFNGFEENPQNREKHCLLLSKSSQRILTIVSELVGMSPTEPEKAE